MDVLPLLLEAKVGRGEPVTVELHSRIGTKVGALSAVSHSGDKVTLEITNVMLEPATTKHIVEERCFATASFTQKSGVWVLKVRST